jgi:arylsulfatase A-like enzyme
LPISISERHWCSNGGIAPERMSKGRMENHATSPEGSGNECAGLVWRFFVASAGAGLLVGILEAAMLWTAPRVAALLTRDVRYVIWFLAPLVDMMFFGLVGLALGLFASRTRFLQLAVALESGIVVAFVALAWRWFHRDIALQSYSFHEDFVVPLACLSSGFAATLAVLFLMRHRLRGSFKRRQGMLPNHQAWALAAAAFAAVAGVGIFAARPSWPGMAVRAAAASPAHGPNIVFITLDTVRADHLSSYGYSRSTTPLLDRLARQGVLFENAIAPTSWTLASHASMFTGLLPHQHGAGYDVPMPPGARTLAEILGSRGYETAGFTSNFHYMEKGWGLARGFETYEDNSASLRHNLAQTFVGSAVIQPLFQTLVRYDYFNRRNAREVNQDVFRWFRGRPARPYFLFINYLDAHEPYLAPPPFDHRFGTASMGLLRRLHHSSASGATAPHFTAAERASLTAAYDNCIAYLDGRVGRLLDFLRRSPGWDNTIVIITSDHGEEFGGHGHYSHGKDLYLAALRVPLIIAGPGVPRGLRISHVVATQELFSTVLDLAVRGHTPFSRYSLARFWNPGFRPLPFDTAVVSELSFPWYWRAPASTLISVTTPEWQYLDDSTGHPRLYRWRDDPRETEDLAVSAEGRAAVQILQGQLRVMIGNSVPPWRGGDYLFHLGGQSPFLDGVLLSRPPQAALPRGALRIGASQAYFSGPQAWEQPRLSPSQQDLMRSLPYQ